MLKYLSLLPNKIQKLPKNPLKYIDFPEEAKIGGLYQRRQWIYCQWRYLIQEGDKVVVFTLPSGIKKLRNSLNNNQ